MSLLLSLCISMVVCIMSKDMSFLVFLRRHWITTKDFIENPTDNSQSRYTEGMLELKEA